ncbi:glycoside hydrolase family 66 protein [Paenibacillus glycanilyticus]|uniref:glycoside hydrolase family 66 protein n=1 Tax=Paenibacillus glycanilyticus TaxID=126569 RepID=UPI003EC08571
MNKLNKTLLQSLAAIVALQGAVPVFEAAAGEHTAKAYAETTSSEQRQFVKAITSLTVDKARYTPGEEATLTFALKDDSSWSGELHVEIYQLNKLVAKGAKAVTVLQGQGELQVKWKPPAEDYKGYLVKAWIKGAASDDFATAAIDVSSDWKKYPRYGYVGEFPKEKAEQSDAKLKQLSQDYYLNGYQFYDWMWRHDVSVYSKTDSSGKPITDENGNFITETMDADTHYTDLLGRELFPMSVKQQVAAAQKYGSAAMAYEMNYAARESYEDFGVSPLWGLYNKSAQFPLDTGNPQKDQNGFTFDVNGHPTSLFLQDPGNTEWQAFIANEFNRAVNEFGFNGIHLDQWGANDNDYLYDYNGNKRYYSLDYDKLINAVKNSLAVNNPNRNDVTFNMVGGNAEYSAVPNPATKTDFDYSEIWQDRNQYRDLQKVVEDTRSANGGKAMVIAGYMNYKQATGVTTRGTEAEDVPATVDYQSRISKAYGWVGNFGRKDTDAVTFTVTVPEAGNYNLVLNYGQGNGATGPEGKLSVNGEVADAAIPFSVNTGWGNPTAQYTVPAELKAGENTVKLTLNTNNLWLNLASLDVVGSGVNDRYEAVDAKLDTAIVDQYSNVYYFDTKGDYLKFRVRVPEAGDYPLGFSYASDWQTVSRDLIVNDQPQGSVAFPGNGTRDKFITRSGLATVHLEAGDNTIMLKAPTDDLGIKLRYMTVGDKKYEALYADIPQTNSISYNESKTDNFGQPGQTVTYEVDLADAVDRITVLYHGDNSPTMTVLVDGEPAASAQKVLFPKTPGGWGGAMQRMTLEAAVPAGHHAITLRMESSGQYTNVGGLLTGGYEYSTGSAVTGGGVIPVVGYASDFNNENDRLAFNVDAEEAGSYDLHWFYRNNGSDVVPLSRSVYIGDGAGQTVSFAPTASDEWGEAVLSGVQLQKGANRVVIKMLEGSDSGIQLDKLKVIPAGGGSLAERSYEAESLNTVTPFSLYKDTVMNFSEVGQQVTYPVTIPQSGEQSLIFTYSNPGAFTTRSVYIDGVRAKDANGNTLKLGLSGTDNKDRYSGDGYVIIPHMTAGQHTVTLKMEEDDEPGMIQLRGVTAGYFDESSVRLMDAALASMGATHIELGTAEKLGEGPNMLAHEYYPNRSKKMTESTKEAMKDYYKFFAAYENLLFDSKADSDATIGVKTAGGNDLALSKDGSENTLWYTVRRNASNEGYEHYDIIHLVNLLNNDSDWRNAANEPEKQGHLKVDYAVGVTKQEAAGLKVFAATPDRGEGAMTELTYTWNGDHIAIDVPSVDYWTMLVVDRDPKQGQAQQLDLNGSGGSGGGTAVIPPSEGSRTVTEQDVNNAANGQVAILLEKGTDRVLLPVSLIGSLGTNKLALRASGGLTLQWNPDTLKKLASSAPAGAYMELVLKPLPSTAAPAVAPAMKLKGTVYSIELNLKAMDGRLLTSAQSHLQAEVESEVSAPKLTGKLLGLYVYDRENSQWKYAGGRYKASNGSFTAELNISGTFAVFEYEKSYLDVGSSSWFYEAVASLSAKHVVNGVTEKQFAPERKGTRAEVMAMIVRALNLSGNGASSAAGFKDVPAGAWYSKELSAAYEAELIQGDASGRFNPNAPITRQELAVMLLRAYKLAGGELPEAEAGRTQYADAALIAAWAKKAIAEAGAAGLMQGDGNGQFAPGRQGTRSEIAQAIDNLLEKI